MKRPPVVFAAVLLILGVGYLAMALQMPRGTLSMPGPGSFPVLAGGLLILTTACFLLWELWSNRTHNGAENQEEASPSGLGLVSPKALQLILLLVLFAVAMNYVGYVISVTLLVFVSIRLFGFKRLLPTVVITAATVGVSYLVFIEWLKVPLPKGIFW